MYVICVRDVWECVQMDVLIYQGHKPLGCHVVQVCEAPPVYSYETWIFNWTIWIRLLFLHLGQFLKLQICLIHKYTHTHTSIPHSVRTNINSNNRINSNITLRVSCPIAQYGLWMRSGKRAKLGRVPVDGSQLNTKYCNFDMSDWN